MTTASGERTLESHAADTARETAAHAIDRIAQSARPDVIFGQPIERGEVTIIPCCEIALGMGMGGGAGSGPAPNTTEKAGGEGVGAGGGARGRPVATIIISQGRVRVEPIVDATRVALAGLTTAGFMAFWVTRLIASARMQSGRRMARNMPGPPIARLVRELRAARMR